MILGVGVYVIALNAGWPNPEAWIFFPLVVEPSACLPRSWPSSSSAAARPTTR